MDVTIANHRSSSFGITESKEDRVEVKINEKFSRNLTKEATIASKAEPI